MICLAFPYAASYGFWAIINRKRGGGVILDGTSPLGAWRKKVLIPMIHGRVDLQTAGKNSSARDTDEVSNPLFAPRERGFPCRFLKESNIESY